MKPATLMRMLTYWPPYLGAGVRVYNVAPDMTSLEVEMKLRFWNRNYVGTQFGGSLYSMVDPFYMLMLMANLGSGYIVWDKAATIRFRSPGRGKVRARFELSRAEIDAIRSRADEAGKTEPQFRVEIVDESGKLVAEVEKTLSVRKKKAREPKLPG